MTGLHVYSPSMWHDEGGIVGTRDALVLLRVAIDDALTNGKSTIETFAADGEEYDLHVVCVEPEKIVRVQLPYVNPIAHSDDSGMHWTEILIGDGNDHA
jgi:hypothetical protein